MNRLKEWFLHFVISFSVLGWLDFTLHIVSNGDIQLIYNMLSVMLQKHN